MLHKKIEEYSDILTTKDVHDILGIGFNKTYALLKSGEIPSFKIGNSIRIPRKGIYQYITKMLEEGASR